MLREPVELAEVTHMHPLGYAFVHVATSAVLGTKECDSSLQQRLAGQLNCVRHRAIEDCDEADFLQYQRCCMSEWLMQERETHL